MKSLYDWWFERRERRVTRQVAAALPELTARMSADPQGFGEPVSPECAEQLHRMLAEHGDICVMESLGPCSAQVATWERPAVVEGGYRVAMYSCDRHAEQMDLVNSGFVRHEAV